MTPALPSREASRVRFTYLLLCFFVVLLTFGARQVSAHEGHDHGPPAPALPSTVKPRVAIQTDTYELVAVANSGQLTIFLDQVGNNAAVTGAKIEVVAGIETIAADGRPDGSYRALVPAVAAPGRYDLIFNVTHKDGDDLLAGTLEIPAAAPDTAPGSTGVGSGGVPALGGSSIWIPVLALALGIVIGLALRGRRTAVVSLVILGSLALPQPSASAHDGHGPSPAPSGESLSGDVPRRLADGSVFLPKASQRLMTVRTQVAVEGEANRGTTLAGRIISDPNRSGVVQSIAGGRVSPPATGLPRLGQKVKKGDVLATVDPAVPLADQSTIAEKQRELEGDILLAEQKLARQNKLGPNITPRSQMEDTELDISNLKRRIATL